MASTRKFEAIYHAGKNKNASIRINVGEHDGTYPKFVNGVPTIVDAGVAELLGRRDDFTVNPVVSSKTKKPAAE